MPPKSGAYLPKIVAPNGALVKNINAPNEFSGARIYLTCARARTRCGVLIFQNMDCVKIVLQVAIIFGCAFFGEAVKALLGVPVPACLIGMGLLFALLCAGIVKPEHIRQTAGLLIAVFPVMFVAPAVGISAYANEAKVMLVPICAAVFFTTILCAVMTGKVSQKIIEKKSK